MAIKRRIVIFAVVAAGLATVGLVFFSFFSIVNLQDFDCKADQEVAGLSASVDTTKRGLRYLGSRSFRILAISRPPYDVTLDFFAVTGAVQTATLNRLTIQYQGEATKEVIGPNQKMSWVLKSRVQPVWEGKGLVYHEDLFVEGRVTNCITKAAPFSLTCEVEFSRDTGERASVTNKWDVRWTGRNSGVIPNVILDVAQDAPPGYPLP